MTCTAYVAGHEELPAGILLMLALGESWLPLTACELSFVKAFANCSEDKLEMSGRMLSELALATPI